SVQEDVAGIVDVVGDKVGGHGLEAHLCAKVVDGGGVAATVWVLAFGSRRYAHSRTAQTVPKEHVECLIPILSGQNCRRMEHDDAAICRNVRQLAEVGSLLLGGGNRYALGQAHYEIANEDVVDPVRVIWYQVRRSGGKGDGVAIPRQGSMEAETVGQLTS